MTPEQSAATAVTATSFGEKTGYIHPGHGLEAQTDIRLGFTAGPDTTDLHVAFTLVVFAQGKYFGVPEPREFTVWTQGKDAQMLLDVFSEREKIALEKVRVTVEIADEYLDYEGRQPEWCIRARSIKLPGITD
ncbi:hypothetical protein [Streptomyces sp. NPDC014006]|uniref:hypothetical protein n=1 Tax=Streptomyces sp. NPDC014006 TaxID=3364870 RepID=UPI0036FF894B